MPDMTPWSYPKRNTPRETKTLVKYLELFSPCDTCNLPGETLQKWLSRQAMGEASLSIARHNGSNDLLNPADLPWSRVGDMDSLFVNPLLGVPPV